jgi:hypothetical protein
MCLKPDFIIAKHYGGLHAYMPARNSNFVSGRAPNPVGAAIAQCDERRWVDAPYRVNGLRNGVACRLYSFDSVHIAIADDDQNVAELFNVGRAQRVVGKSDCKKARSSDRGVCDGGE